MGCVSSNLKQADAYLAQDAKTKKVEVKQEAAEVVVAEVKQEAAEVAVVVAEDAVVVAEVKLDVATDPVV